MKVVDCVQGTPEWMHARCGKITASEMSDVMAILTRKSINGKAGDPAGARIDLCDDLAGERISNRASENFVSNWMEKGIEQEPFARAAYEIQTGVTVDQVGFVIHPLFDFAGASPDGLVGTDGLVEIKCPKTRTHIRYWKTDAIPKDYQLQMLWQMECCEREWCDFVSYDGTMPERFQLFIRRLHRDEERLKEIRAEVQKLNAEVNALVTQLESGNSLMPQLVASLEAIERFP